MSRARSIQRAQRHRVGELSRPIPVEPIQVRVVGMAAEREPAAAYEPKLIKRVAAFGYVLLTLALTAWVFAALAEGAR